MWNILRRSWGIGNLDEATLEQLVTDEGFLLLPNTTYWITVAGGDMGNPTNVSYTTSASEQGRTGWSIGNMYSEGGGSMWSAATGTAALRMGILGDVVEFSGKPRMISNFEEGLLVDWDVSDVSPPEGYTLCCRTWVRVDTDGTETDLHTYYYYLMTQEDVGKRLKVRMSYRNAGDEETALMVASDLSPVVRATSPFLVGNLRQQNASGTSVFDIVHEVDGRVTSKIAQQFMTGGAPIRLDAVRLGANST